MPWWLAFPANLLRQIICGKPTSNVNGPLDRQLPPTHSAAVVADVAVHSLAAVHDVFGHHDEARRPGHHTTRATNNNIYHCALSLLVSINIRSRSLLFVPGPLLPCPHFPPVKFPQIAYDIRTGRSAHDASTSWYLNPLGARVPRTYAEVSPSPSQHRYWPIFTLLPIVGTPPTC